jgi:folate-binding Fe-S cluster repair protein YgfZ
VSFDKGCYTGQEVIARTRHLGQAKRRLMRYRLDGGQAVPGQGLQRDGANVGETVNAAGTDLLAVLSLECAGESLDAAGHVAIPVELPYAIPGVEPAT